MTSFAALIAISREEGGMNAVEFNYTVARAGKSHYRDCFGDAAYILARRQMPTADWRAVRAEANKILDHYAADIDAFGAAAQQMRFTGWSDSGKIRYATEKEAGQ